VTPETFWGIIETARSQSGPELPFDQALTRQLASLTEDGIFEFQETFYQLRNALYRWDVWAAAYLIGGGCSDDSFIDFRAGVIAQGREWYEKAQASPDSLADNPAARAGRGWPDTETLFYEAVNYAAADAFNRVTGRGNNDFYQALKRSREARQDRDRSEPDMGEDFDFDDPREMRRRLPRLATMCLGDGPDEPPPRRLLG
jgi:hypothetical protein